MRILHTADWHLGQTLAGYGREHEHRAVLAALREVVVAREVDAIVVAGDVFDSQNPSGEAQRMLYEELLALTRARSGLQIVLTAGNHDAAGRLEAPAALLHGIGVRVVGSVRRPGGVLDASRHLVHLLDPRGGVGVDVLAVSYPTAACLTLRTLDGEGAGSPIVAATRELYRELMEGVRALLSGAPLLVTGHLHVAGGIESEGAERRILVGGQHAVPPDVFPAEAAYVALGHLHRRQWVGREAVRYAGSLIPMSAAEIGYGHGVTLVHVQDGGLTIEEIDLPRPVPFLRLPEAGEMPVSEVAERLAALALSSEVLPEQRPFLQIVLSRAKLPAGFRAEVDRIAAEFPVRLVDVRVPPPPGEARQAASDDPVARLADLAPEDLFRQAFDRAHGRAPSPAHLEAFHRVAAAGEG